MATPPPPPPPPQQRRLHSPPGLFDEIFAEILLRLPPDDPARLVRFCLVCKRWCRRLTDPAFLRRFREFHRTPPMLGFLFNVHEPHVARFIPTTAFRPPNRDHPGWYALGSRHGRVLFLAMEDPSEEETLDLIVWDPMTGGQWAVPLPEVPWTPTHYDAAVLCAAGGGCEHLDCHGGPFRVVFVGTDDEYLTCAFVYSSEAGAWGGTTYIVDPEATVLHTNPSVLVGNTLYFQCDPSTTILQFDLDKLELSVIDTPSWYGIGRGGVLIEAEGGALGLAGVQGSSLHLWSREAAGTNGAVEWAQRRVIELEPLLPIAALSRSPDVIGFANGVDVVFLCTDAGIFTIELKSGRVNKVHIGATIDRVIPYMSFYTPAGNWSCYGQIGTAISSQ